MMIGILIEFALGVASLALLPFGRPDQWLPAQGRGVYVAHAVLGGLLTMGALTILIRALSGSKFARASERKSASAGSCLRLLEGHLPCHTPGDCRAWG